MSAQRLGFRDSLEFLAKRVGSFAAAEAHYEERTGSGPSQVRRTGLDGWVEHASGLLWQAYGAAVRQWLTIDRGLPVEVLKLHRIGATGLTPQDDMPIELSVEGLRSATPTAVLPVMSRGSAIYAQLRFIEPSQDRQAYINPRVPPGSHPRLALFRPPRARHPEIIVTEGIIDALSANAAGYRAAAVLAPGLADAATAVHLARLTGPLVLALDPDDSGAVASDRLAGLLWAKGRRPALLAELTDDLNDTLVASIDWPRKLLSHVRNAVASGPPDRVPEV